MKRKLRKEVKIIIALLTLTTALHTVNTALEHRLMVKRIQLEDQIVIRTLQQPTQPLCSTSSTKSYMDYRTITSKTSKQYRYIKEYMTVSEDGFLHHNTTDRIGVALGSVFGPIGTYWDVTLDTGITLHLVKIDEKDDSHTINGCQHTNDGSVIEFVIDSKSDAFKPHIASNGYIYQGNFNNNPQLQGTLSYIQLGRQGS